MVKFEKDFLSKYITKSFFKGIEECYELTVTDKDIRKAEAQDPVLSEVAC